MKRLKHDVSADGADIFVTAMWSIVIIVIMAINFAFVEDMIENNEHKIDELNDKIDTPLDNSTGNSTCNNTYNNSTHNDMHVYTIRIQTPTPRIRCV